MKSECKRCGRVAHLPSRHLCQPCYKWAIKYGKLEAYPTTDLRRRPAMERGGRS
jgi:uncharacterized OB-fold protein